ncbi:MAG: class I SAM-dependent methyltransferase family protein [Candidatus Nanoarchaeia archaeon]|nr:class I SAM-dependent methyltransferase family protein [Candidatus Nanoarchaeia archaeon]MDD5239282.1 class I SAM-dependent methyltransferase family protein [Candidatus Nanoarchaeia archaeon]
MTTLKEELKGKISDKELELVKKGFDVIGDVAVLEIPDALKKKEKVIAEAVMRLYPCVKVAAKKIGATSGVERIRKVKVILGERRTETLYIENGCRYKLDINKVYFSPRLGSEHLRVAEQVKPKETVYDLFCGVGPYVIPCAKRGAKVFAVDINKDAIKYLAENVKLNKVMDKVDFAAGDCRKVAMKKEHRGKADRVIMNHPSGADKFLDVAFYVAKKGAVIHFYCFLKEDEFDAGIKLIQAAAKKAKRKIRILNTKKCGQWGPRIWRCAIEFKAN